MMADIINPLFWAVAFAFFIPAKLYRNKKAITTLILIVSISAIAIHIPFPPYGYALIDFLRGIYSDPSITSAVFLCVLIMQRAANIRLFQTNEIFIASSFILVVAAVFYPLSLGAAATDLYSIGYGEKWFKGLVLGISLLCAVNYFYVSALTIALGVLAFELQLLESTNLWDYLIDPVITLVILITGINYCVKSMSGKYNFK